MDLQVMLSYILSVMRQPGKQIQVVTDRFDKFLLDVTPENARTVELLEEVAKERSPVALEVEPEARLLRRVYHPIVDVIVAFDEDEHADGDLRVQASELPTLLTLCRNSPNFSEMYGVLRDAYESREQGLQVAMAVRPGDREILDVRALGKPERKSGAPAMASPFDSHVPAGGRKCSRMSALYTMLQTNWMRIVVDPLQTKLGKGRRRR